MKSKNEENIISRGSIHPRSSELVGEVPPQSSLKQFCHSSTIDHLNQATWRNSWREAMSEDRHSSLTRQRGLLSAFCVWDSSASSRGTAVAMLMDCHWTNWSCFDNGCRIAGDKKVRDVNPPCPILEYEADELQCAVFSLAWVIRNFMARPTELVISSFAPTFVENCANSLN